MSNIAVVGTGYVGLVAGTLFADCGHTVACCDVDEKKIKTLNTGVSTIYEEGLEELIQKNLKKGGLTFTTDIPSSIKNAEVVFIAVGTPPLENGEADLSYVRDVAAEIGRCLNGYKVIVDKSTVPVGTAREVSSIIKKELSARGESIDFEVVSNPEFLREGTSVYDFTHPDRVVIGCRSQKAFEIMNGLYWQLIGDEAPIVKVLPETAEMIKYASNAFLAVKISYINELACLCEKVGADVEEVAHSMGLDNRISEHFLQAGPGYGGSCFPKDTSAICKTARQHDVELNVIGAAITANENQKQHMVEKIKRELNGVSDKTLCILGVTFKPGTDDMRDSPALVIVRSLIENGAKIRIYDPQCGAAKDYFGDIWDSITVCCDEYQAARGADAAVLITHWPQFKAINLPRLKDEMKGCHFFDLRNMFSGKKEKFSSLGYRYYGVGKA